MRTSQHATQGYALADSEHVLKAATKHWAALQSLGASDAEKRRFTQTIADASRLYATQPEAPLALEEARQALKDLVGAYRSAAGLVANGIDGRDPKAEQALKLKGSFPATDVLLAGYTDGLAARMRPWSSKLASRGFGKEKQTQLVEAAAAFKKAFSARGKERGAARAETLAREVAFKDLRTQTSYFRRLGREALRSTTARADFDRVKLPAKTGAPQAVPAQSAA